jgi:hypothetical protein
MTPLPSRSLRAEAGPPLRVIPGVSPRPSRHLPRSVRRAQERIVRGGRVLFFPAPNGSVRIIGLSDTDEWIAEFSCREADFSEAYLRRMEQHVTAKSRTPLTITG